MLSREHTEQFLQEIKEEEEEEEENHQPINCDILFVFGDGIQHSFLGLCSLTGFFKCGTQQERITFNF